MICWTPRRLIQRPRVSCIVMENSVGIFNASRASRAEERNDERNRQFQRVLDALALVAADLRRVPATFHSFKGRNSKSWCAFALEISKRRALSRSGVGVPHLKERERETL